MVDKVVKIHGKSFELTQPTPWCVYVLLKEKVCAVYYKSGLADWMTIPTEDEKYTIEPLAALMLMG